MSRLTIPFLAAALLIGCHTATTPFPAADVLGMAPPPYTAEQIRAAHPSGSQVVFEFVGPTGAVDGRVQMRFEDATNLGVEVHTLPLDANGEPAGEATVAAATWEQLRSHAFFPAADTELAHARVRVPAGHYECWVYRVHSGTSAGQVDAYHFAVDRPGPPVLLVTEVDGLPTKRMQLAVDDRP